MFRPLLQRNAATVSDAAPTRQRFRDPSSRAVCLSRLLMLSAAIGLFSDPAWSYGLASGTAERDQPQPGSSGQGPSAPSRTEHVPAEHVPAEHVPAEHVPAEQSPAELSPDGQRLAGQAPSAPAQFAAIPSERSAADWLERFEQRAASAPASCPEAEIPALDSHAPAQAFVLSMPPNEADEPLVATIKDPIVELFIVLSEDADGCIRSGVSGRLVAFESRSFPSPFPNTELPRHFGAAPTVAIVADHKSVRPWLELVPAARFECLSERLWVAFGMFTGMLATLFVVGLLIARYYPSDIVWAYLAYIVALQLYQLQALGIGPAWLPFWPPPSMHHLTQALAAGTAVIGMSLPVITFLRPQGHMRILLVIGVALSASGFYLSALDAAAYRFGAAVLPALAVIVITLLVRRLRNPDPAMRWFAIGLAAALAGGGMQAAAVVLQGAGLPPIAAFGFPIGNVVESICWLIAILLRAKGHQLALQHRLIFEAHHDALTQVYSRSYMHGRIAQAIADAKDPQRGASGLLYIDLGAFRLINDRFGQSVGDRVLREFAQTLLGLGLNADAIGRYSGEEFVVLMSRDAHWSHTEGAAVTILGRFRDPLEIDEQHVLLRPDIGVVRIGADYREVDEVIQDANRALRLAKQLGGRRVTHFEPEMRQRAETRHTALSAAEAAIREERLELHYQPVVELDGMSPIGFEALLRWPQADANPVSIQQVLAVADTAGLLRPLGRRIARLVLEQITDWQRRGVWSPAFFVSINVCEQQLVDGGLLDDLHTGLQQYRIDASDIRLEISERSLGADIDWSFHVLPRLLNQHILLGIDNFGAGLASLTTLTDLQPDYLKIDRSLVASLATLPRAQSLARAGRLLAQDIGCLAIAEGIETEAQLETLREMGFEHGQGRLIAAPMAGADIAAWIQLADRCQEPLLPDQPKSRHLH